MIVQPYGASRSMTAPSDATATTVGTIAIPYLWGELRLAAHVDLNEGVLAA